MDERLPTLTLDREKHKYLIDCMGDSPHILDVFRNIYFGRPLDHGIYIPSMKTLDTYIHVVFIPLFLANKVIVEDPKSPNGYRAIIETFKTEGVNDLLISQIAKNGMNEIVHSIKDNEDKEKSVLAYVSGEIPLAKGKQIVENVRGQAHEVLEIPNSNSEDSRRIRMAIAVKIDD